jgi:hypothetical protein
MCQLGSLFRGNLRFVKGRCGRPATPPAILKLNGHNVLKVAGVNGSFTSLSVVRLAGVALLSKRAQGGTGKLIEGVKRGVLGPRDWARRCCFWLIPAVFLTACSTGISDSFDVGPFLKEQITGDTWRACAAREFQAYARARVRADRDWTEATVWAAKGRAALTGPNGPHHGSDSCDCGRAFALKTIWDTDGARPGGDALKKRSDEALEACTTPR